MPRIGRRFVERVGIGRFLEKASIRRTRRAYQRTKMRIRKQMGYVPEHTMIITSRRSAAFFSGRLPLTRAIRERKLENFERELVNAKLPRLLGSSISKKEAIASLETYLKTGKNTEMKRIATNLLREVKNAKSENVIIVGTSILTSRRAIEEQIGHELGHATLNEIAGKKIDTSTPENAKMHEGFATLFGIAAAKPKIFRRIRDPKAMERAILKMGYPEMYARGARDWYQALDKKEKDVLVSLVKAAIKKLKK